jgi:hypothetical protein
MKANDVEKAKAAAIALLRKARIAVTRCELETMEVADLVKGDGWLRGGRGPKSLPGFSVRSCRWPMPLSRSQ